MRNISFALTTKQFVNRTKTVTRRLGWKFLKVGDRLAGCEKCQGLKKDQKIKKLGMIRVTSVARIPLDSISPDDCIKEGFPELTPSEFINFFCGAHKDCTPGTIVTRIEFEYLGNE